MDVIAIDLGHRYGRLARNIPGSQPDVVEVEFDGVDGVLDPARALPALLAAAGEDSGVGPDPSVVLGLPAAGEGEDELRRAAEAAGLRVERVVPDPVAVALHYGAVAEGVDRSVLVCDHGATSLDLTVLAITPDLTVRVVRTRSDLLGGEDWDEVLAAHLAGRPAVGTDLRRVAQQLRHGLSAAEQVLEPAGDGLPVELSRAELDRVVAPLYQRMLAAVTEELAAEPAVDTVLLAGGLSVAPGHRAGIEALPAARGLTVRCHRPELAVVRGLLLRQEFGVLRVVSGPAPRTSRSPDGYLLLDPEPAARTPYPVAEDPESRTRSAEAVAEDPEPRTRSAEAVAPAVTATVTDPDPGTTDRGPEQPQALSELQEPPVVPVELPHDPVIPQPRHEQSHRSAPAPESAAPPETTPTPNPTPIPTPIPPTEAPPAGTFAVPVADLQAIRRGDHLLVLWAWPDGALSARVRWQRERVERTDGGAADRRLDGDLVCRRRTYEHDGGLDMAVGREAVTLTVEALVTGSGVDCEGSSALIVPAQPRVVEYEPAVRRRLKGRVATVTFTAESGCDLPDLRIVHGLGRFRPTSTAEGTVVHEVRAQRLPARTPLTVEFPLPATKGPSWLVCFPAHGDAATDAGLDIRPTALHRLRVT
ncbi:Hsp70 family protein [Kitasatospora sp. NPDC004669]|uniref:Hsp70 family protein n=1 Tax=Kitasatospora sp. NPDC004669 TaxID=3154555 RepID=UPI0033B8E0B2